MLLQSDISMSAITAFKPETEMATFDFSRLPHEIWNYIIKFLDRDGLKNARLICKTFSEMTTPFLFSVIMISPFMSSVQRARNVADTSHLARHVVKLEYHTGRLSGGFRDFYEFRNETVRLALWRDTKASPQMSQDESTTRRRHQHYVAEMESHCEWLQSDKPRDLQHICSKFVNLIAVTTWNDACENDFDNYYSQLTGLRCSYMPDLGAKDLNYVHNVLRATWGRRIYSVCLSGITWSAVKDLRRFLAKHPACGTMILDIEIDLKYEEIWPDQEGFSDANCKLLESCLRKLPNLRYVRIGVDRYGFLDHGGDIDSSGSSGYSVSQAITDIRMASRRILSIHWSKLDKVLFSGLAFRTEELCEFLLKHRTTLRELRLNEVKVATTQYTTYKLTPDNFPTTIKSITEPLYLDNILINDVRIK